MFIHRNDVILRKAFLRDDNASATMGNKVALALPRAGSSVFEVAVDTTSSLIPAQVILSTEVLSTDFSLEERMVSCGGCGCIASRQPCESKSRQLHNDGSSDERLYALMVIVDFISGLQFWPMRRIRVVTSAHERPHKPLR